jgi:hypothetical protein
LRGLVLAIRERFGRFEALEGEETAILLIEMIQKAGLHPWEIKGLLS